MQDDLIIERIFGWIWLILMPINLFFFVSAVFFRGSWAVFFLVLLLATIAKWGQSWIEHRRKINDGEEKVDKGSRQISK